VTLGFETILPFLRSIEHLIRDDSVSEIMVNGSSSVFIERTGVLEEVPDLTLTEKSLMVAVKNIARRGGITVATRLPSGSLESRIGFDSEISSPRRSIHGVTLTIRKFNSRHFTVVGSMPDSLSASEYILDNFKPSDRIAVLLRSRSTAEVVQRIASAEKIAGRDFQEWLTDRNQAGFDIYVGMNSLKDGAHSRTKRDIHEIRHVYLDLDYRGSEALKAIQNSDEIPKLNFVLDTSPGKHQVVWKVESVAPQEAEDLQQQMAHEFGADGAATDTSRVLRLPGFTNRKYGDECAVRVTKHSDKTYSLRDFKIASGPAKSERIPEQTPSRSSSRQETPTQSERD